MVQTRESARFAPARWRYFGIGFALLVLAGTACTGDDNGQTGATSTSATTPPTATLTSNTEPSAVATGTSATASPDGYPLSRSTGVKDVDDVLAAIASGDNARIRSLLVEIPAPCVVDPHGITDPPLCPPGVTAGTPVPVFRATACGGLWPNELDTILTAWLGRHPLLYAVYRQPAAAYWLPGAEYAVVFNQIEPNRHGSSVLISGGKITGWQFGCGQSSALLLSGVTAGQYVVAPPVPQ